MKQKDSTELDSGVINMARIADGEVDTKRKNSVSR